ncbi:MAG: translation elongation factor Ts [Planctomycetota bacterium]
MAEISAKDVMALRQKTGLSMMECKKALVETGGDHEAAEDYLRKKMKGKMDTRTDRVAGEGRVAVAVNDTGASIVEIRAETDFTAKNDQFIAATDKVAQMTLDAPEGPVEPSDAMKSGIDEIRISTGENASIARLRKVAKQDGDVFGTYVHHDGKTGVLIHANGDAGEDVLRQICMHVTAAVPRPMGVTPDEIPEAIVEKERKFRIEQAVESGKPQEIAEKMVEGGMRKFFSEVALLEQDFVMDPSKKIKDLLGGASIKAFYRWQVGEEA